MAQEFKPFTAADMPVWATILGYGGLIPPVLLLAVGYAGFEAWQAKALGYVITYGAMILSFLGGVSWGYAISLKPDDPRPAGKTFDSARNDLLIYAVLPMLVGFWVLLRMDTDPSHGYLLAASLLLVAFRDRQIIRDYAKPAWFARLRLHLSIGLVLAVLLALLAPGRF